MFSTRLASLVLCAVLLAAPARADDPAPPPDPIVAQSGTVTVTASEVKQMLEAMDPDQRAQLQHDPNLLAQRVRDRLLQKVVLDRAQEEKFDARPEVVWRAEQARQASIVESFLLDQVPADPNFPSEADIARAYEANKTKLLLPRQYQLAQVLIAVPKDAAPDAEAEAAAQKRAADLRKQIVVGHKDFADIARHNSDDKASGAKGGDLGWVRDDTLVPAIRQALAAMQPGGVSDPVRTPDGWHLIKLVSVKPAGQATLSEARDTLVRALRQERSLQMQRRYVTQLFQQAPLRIDQVELWKQTAQ